MEHRAKKKLTHFRVEDKKLTLHHKYGGERANTFHVTEAPENQWEGEDCAELKWRVDGQKGMYAVIDADYCLEQDGKTDVDSICVATPTAEAHEPVSGAMTRYGDVGGVDQRLLLEGETAAEHCMSHKCDRI